MPRLTAGVLLRHPRTGAPAFLPAGSELPAWADGLVGGHALDQAPSRSAPAPASAPKPVPASEPVQPGVPAPPPRYGRGSSAAAWRDWADQAGVDLSGYGPDPSRDQVITAAVRAGVLDDE